MQAGPTPDNYHQASAIDFSTYVAKRTSYFTGRTWVFKTVDAWLGNPHSARVFLITGQPGSGKTALAAQLWRYSRRDVDSPPKPTYLSRA